MEALAAARTLKIFFFFCTTLDETQAKHLRLMSVAVSVGDVVAKTVIREKRVSMCPSRLSDSNLADCSTAESGGVESEWGGGQPVVTHRNNDILHCLKKNKK